MDRGPQVELASGGMALEAAVAMRRQIDPEVAALGTVGLVDRARAAEPTAVAATGDEAQERQDLLDRDLRAQLGKVDGWHDQRIRQSRSGQRRGSGNHPLGLRRPFRFRHFGVRWRGGLLGAMGTIRAALDLQHDRAVHEAVEDGHGQGGIPEVIGPRLEADVGHHGRGPFGTAAIDHLVQEAGRLAGLGPLDPIEPELVNCQEVEVAVVPQPLAVDCDRPTRRSSRATTRRWWCNGRGSPGRRQPFPPIERFGSSPRRFGPR